MYENENDLDTSILGPYFSVFLFNEISEEVRIKLIETSGSTAISSISLVPWQPSSWPKADSSFVSVLDLIFEHTVIGEIRNVINDAHAVHGSLTQRGHVVSLAMFCAVDAISSYAFSDLSTVSARYKKYIETFFPNEYQSFATDLYKFYRNSTVHSWNLFKVGMFPGEEMPQKVDGSLYFGLLNYFRALESSLHSLISTIKTNNDIKENCISRYESLRETARK